MTRKILVTFAIFAKSAALLRPFFAFCLYKCRILFNLLFLLFLRYLQGVSQNFLVNQFFLFLLKLRKKTLAGNFLQLRSVLDISFYLAIARLSYSMIWCLSHCQLVKRALKSYLHTKKIYPGLPEQTFLSPVFHSRKQH